MKRTILKNFRAEVIILLTMLLIGGSLSGAALNGTSSMFKNIPVVTTFQDGNTISVAIPIGPYQIKTTDKGDELSIDSFGQLLVPGKPNLPSKIFEIAIPPGAKIVSVTWDTGTGVILPGNFHVAPSPLPRVIGMEDPSLAFQEQQRYDQNYRSVYTRDTPYPSQVGEFIQTAHYRKYTLADVRVTPFSYQPLSGKLTYYPEVTIHVNYAPAPDGFIPMADNLARAEQAAQGFIINYDQTKNWFNEKAPLTAGLHDFVIITLDSLTSEITPLVNWETTKGRTVEVVTTSWIDTNYNGYDLAAKMRSFLLEKYPSSEWGILDCLLIGGYDDVPMRRCAQDVGYGQPRTDLYYAELSLPDDQSWDSNGNHQYGDDGDNIEFTTEISVGRIPWSDPTTVQHICEKSVAYEQNSDPAFKNNILLLGAFFWPDTDNAVLMDYKTNPDINPWMSTWTGTRMFEQGYSTHPMDYDLTYNNVRDVWSAGSYGFVDWAGHGSPTVCVRYFPYETDFVNTQTCPSLNDAYPSIVFADACSNSDTDYANIGQIMLKQGAVGFLGATQVALGCPGWNNKNSGSSQSLDYYFTSAVTSGNYTQGQALQFGLHQMYVNGLWDYLKYEMFEWGSIWGNPDLGMMPRDLNQPPVTPIRPTGPSLGIVQEIYTYTATTPQDPEGSSVYLMWDWGDGSFSDWLGPFSEGQDIQTTHSWGNPGTYAVRLKAKDVNGSESSWSEPFSVTINAQPRLDISMIKGGIGVRITIHNRINETLSNISWSINLNGGFILRSQGLNGVVVSIPAGQDSAVKSGFILGLGRITIIVSAAEATKTVSGMLIGPFLVGIR
jgi:hypothetical protein